MAAVVRVDTSQLDRLIIDFGRNALAAREQVKRATVNAGARIERAAKPRSPVDTGANRGSISTSVKDEARGGTFTVEVGPTTDYGGYLETGTSRMAPRPYMGPAFDQVLPSYIAALDVIAARMFDEP